MEPICTAPTFPTIAWPGRNPWWGQPCPMAILPKHGNQNRSFMNQTYNFDEIIDRTQTDSVKWSINEKLFGRKDVFSMWVADMDFRAPEPVIQALVRRAQEGVFGYPTRHDSYHQAVIDWLQKRHGWET